MSEAKIARFTNDSLRGHYHYTLGDLVITGSTPGIIAAIAFRGKFWYPTEDFALRRNGRLSRKQMTLLDVLARHPHQAVRNRDLMLVLYGSKRVSWPDPPVLKVHVAAIRKVLHRKFGKEVASMLQTVWGIGYGLSNAELRLFGLPRGKLYEWRQARGYKKIVSR